MSIKAQKYGFIQARTFKAIQVVIPSFLKKHQEKNIKGSLGGGGRIRKFKKKRKPEGIFPVHSEKQEVESTAHSTHSKDYEDAKNSTNP